MIKNKDIYLTSTEVATLLGFTPDYIRALIRQGVLPAEKLGTLWLVKKTDLKGIERKRFPRKQTNGIN